MKKITSLVLAAFLLVSSFASCAAPTEISATASADGIAEYTAFLRENLTEMPDSLVIGDADTASEHGIDMSDFEDEGFFTRAADGEVLIFGKTEAGIDRGVRDFVKYGNNDAYTKTYGEGYRVKRLTIAGNDISEYVIVYDSESPSKVEQPLFAAEQLSMYIEKSCGAKLSYYSDVEFAALDPKPVRTITITVDYPALGNEAFRIEVGNDGNLTIAGGRVRGYVYGVYDLLEDNIGWRFFDDILSVMNDWTAEGEGIEYLYEADHIDLTSAINRLEEPLFESRRMDTTNGYKTLNGSNAHLYNYYSYKAKISANWYSGHGLNQINWAGGAFDLGGCGQPCLTDEGNMEIIDEHVITTVESLIAAGQVPGMDFYGISLGQYDGLVGYCKCNECMKVAAEEGSAAGLYIRAANRAAQLLKDMGYGELHINILAYVETSIPPKKTMPLDNVRVAFCFYAVYDTNACNAHPLNGKDCDPYTFSTNKILAERFKQWSAVCTPGNIDVWYYPLHHGMALTGAPMVLNLYEDIKYLSENGVGAIINTVDGDSSQYALLMEYLLNHICWQFPESYDEFLGMIYEWLWLNYGDGADYLYEYLMEYERLGKKVECYTTFYVSVSNMSYINRFDMISNFDYFCGLFEEARRLANTSVQVERIEHMEAGMLYLGVCCAYNAWYVRGTADKKALLVERYRRLHLLCTKYHLRVYLAATFEGAVYAPSELNLDENPIMWYAVPAKITDSIGDILG